MSKRVIIIGSGPAGLASARCLGSRNVEYVLLERGPVVSTAIRRVDPEMVLLSPTSLSRLPEMARPSGAGNYLSFLQLVGLLDDYQRQGNIPLITGAQVTRVISEGKGFAVHYRSEQEGEGKFVEGSHVINATGIISHPSLPRDFDPGACSFGWMHSLDVRAAHLASCRELLVIGGGPSASEVLERWLEVRSPGSSAWISLRGALRAMPHRILGVDVHYLVWLPEHLPANGLGRFSSRFREPMTGLAVARAVRRGVIGRQPGVASYKGNEVTFSNGARLQPDLVVFATGFEYATTHLGELITHRSDGTPMVRNCESLQTRGLFLLGLRFGRTLASAYLRGIARDSKYVVYRIIEG